MVEKLTLTHDTLKIGDQEFKIGELEKFDIDADDFWGKSTDFFGTSVGTDNFVEFTQNGTKYSFQFQVKRITDLKLLSDISKEIKTRSMNVSPTLSSLIKSTSLY